MPFLFFTIIVFLFFKKMGSFFKLERNFLSDCVDPVVCDSLRKD